MRRRGFFGLLAALPFVWKRLIARPSAPIVEALEWLEGDMVKWQYVNHDANGVVIQGALPPGNWRVDLAARTFTRAGDGLVLPIPTERNEHGALVYTLPAGEFELVNRPLPGNIVLQGHSSPRTTLR